jgi:hypothetical protein
MPTADARMAAGALESEIGSPPTSTPVAFSWCDSGFSWTFPQTGRDGIGSFHYPPTNSSCVRGILGSPGGRGLTGIRNCWFPPTSDPATYRWCDFGFFLGSPPTGRDGIGSFHYPPTISSCVGGIFGSPGGRGLTGIRNCWFPPTSVPASYRWCDVDFFLGCPPTGRDGIGSFHYPPTISSCVGGVFAARLPIPALGEGSVSCLVIIQRVAPNVQSGLSEFGSEGLDWAGGMEPGSSTSTRAPPRALVFLRIDDIQKRERFQLRR